LKTETSKKRDTLGRQAGTVLTILLLFSSVSQLSLSLAAPDSPIASETLTLTAYLDGFVLATHEFEINQTYPAVNVSLLGENQENLLFLDEQNLPLDYSVANGEVTVFSLGASRIKVSYLTQDLTAKTSQYWTLTAQVSTNTTVILPEATTIISLNSVPETIESSDGQVTLVMPAGTIEITYVAEHNLAEPTENGETPWLLIAAFSLLLIPVFAFVFWFLRHKKTVKLKPEEPQETQAVDVDRLLKREKDLRQEEVQVIRFLAEKNGSAFEAELYEKLQLPRTTTWRLLKRLERMEIVDIKKARRQNLVSVRKKYMKK
jgi:uncharacterized membrane protein